MILPGKNIVTSSVIVSVGVVFCNSKGEYITNSPYLLGKENSSFRSGKCDVLCNKDFPQRKKPPQRTGKT